MPRDGEIAADASRRFQSRTVMPRASPTMATAGAFEHIEPAAVPRARRASGIVSSAGGNARLVPGDDIDAAARRSSARGAGARHQRSCKFDADWDRRRAADPSDRCGEDRTVYGKREGDGFVGRHGASLADGARTRPSRDRCRGRSRDDVSAKQWTWRETEDAAR